MSNFKKFRTTMTALPAAQTRQSIDPMVSILTDNIRVYDAQIKLFESWRVAPSREPPVSPRENQLKIQILASFETISQVRSEQRQICLACIDQFNRLSKLQSPEESANIRKFIETSLSRLEKLEYDFLKYVPILEEAKHMNERTVTKI
jgi:hypothetical protein